VFRFGARLVFSRRFFFHGRWLMPGALVSLPGFSNGAV